jgi:hypothetical protein
MGGEIKTADDETATWNCYQRADEVSTPPDSRAGQVRGGQAGGRCRYKELREPELTARTGTCKLKVLPQRKIEENQNLWESFSSTSWRGVVPWIDTEERPCKSRQVLYQASSGDRLVDVDDVTT